jgi:serine/threonine-protein kinase
MYEVISGLRAFPGDDAVSVAHRVVHNDPEAPGVVAPDVRVPKEVDRAIMRGLEKDPSYRYANAMEMMDALAGAYVRTGVLDRDPTGAQILPVPEQPRERTMSSWLFAAVAIGLLGLGLAMVFAFVDADLSGVADLPDGSLDASLAELADAGHATAMVDDAGTDDAGSDAAAEADAGTDAATTTGLPDVSSMDGFERDELCKNEISNARIALANGELDAAAQALARARVYDAGNTDIAALEARLRQARTEGP